MTIPLAREVQDEPAKDGAKQTAAGTAVGGVTSVDTYDKGGHLQRSGTGAPRAG